MSPKRIVLMEPSGDVLFEGLSMLSEPPPPPTVRLPRVDEDDDAVEIPIELDADIEPCPPTMRSAESGFFSTRERRDRAGTGSGEVMCVRDADEGPTPRAA